MLLTFLMFCANLALIIFCHLVNKISFSDLSEEIFLNNLFSQQLEALGSLHSEATTVHMSLSTLEPLLCYWSLVDTEIQTWYHWNWAKSLNFYQKMMQETDRQTAIITAGLFSKMLSCKSSVLKNKLILSKVFLSARCSVAAQRF